MRGVERAAGGDDGDERLLRPVAPRPQLGKRVRGRRIGAIDPPRSLRRREQRAGADEDGICARAQEGEDKTIGITLVSQERVRTRQPRHRDHTVERLDEVRDDTRLVEADRAAVERRKLRRNVPPRQVLVFGEDREGLDHRVSVRNSVRRESSSS